MPPPTRDQFDAAAAKVAATAPAGLSREQFFDLIDKELAAPVKPPAGLSFEEPGSKAGLALAGAGKGTAAAAKVAEQLATSPNVAKVGAKVGRVVGGLAPVIAGATQGGPVGAAVGLTLAAKGAWAGGKTGWFTGKLGQNLAAPVANVLIKATPYMMALNRLAGPQSALDLAQLAEPGRRDIGFLGIGPSEHVAGEHPALLNLAAQKIGDSIRALMGHGLQAEEAADLLLKAHSGAK